MFLSILLTVALGTDPKMADFYIGTYTSTNGSKGIYHARMDSSTGAISTPALAVEAPNPSFLAINTKERALYAVNESSGGEVRGYKIQQRSALSLLNTQGFDGSGPCHLSVSREGANLLVASYGGGSVTCIPIAEGGMLAPTAETLENTGSGPDKGRQEAPHLHSIYSHGEYVYACDLGTDEILIFRITSDGSFTKVGTARVQPGAGPRHMAFHPHGKFAYVNNEMACSVTAFGVGDGKLATLQTISTLPAGVNPRRKTTAEIACHPNGKWLYVSNRGHDSIAVYQIHADGRLKLIQVQKTGVKEPRSFDIDPSGHWIVAAGQSSDDLTSLKIDQTTGKLLATGNRVSVDKPVCVLFVRP